MNALARIALSLLAAAALLALSASAAPAAGRTCASAPGTSAIDQYCESIPGAGGNVSTGGGTRTPPDAAQRVLPRATYERLAAGGATDAAILGVVGRTADGKRGRDREGGADRSAAQEAAGTASQAAPSSDPLAAVASAVSDGPTLGAFLPIALVVIAVGAIAFALVGRGGRRGPDAS